MAQNGRMNSVNDRGWIRRWLAASVVLHFVVVLWHGSVHTMLPVPLTGAQAVFVGSVIILLPLVGAGSLWTRYRGLAAWTIALSMFGSFVFGVINHYILVSPDNVMVVPAHAERGAFIVSAALLSVTEVIGTVLSVIAIRSLQPSA